MPMDKYRMLDVTTHMTTMITTKRLCPNQCSFCSQQQCTEEKLEVEVQKNIVDEIEYLKTITILTQ